MRPSGKSIESGQEDRTLRSGCAPIRSISGSEATSWTRVEGRGRKRKKRWPRERKGTGGWTNSIVVGRLTAIGQERYMYSVTGFNTRRAS